MTFWEQQAIRMNAKELCGKRVRFVSYVEEPSRFRENTLFGRVRVSTDSDARIEFCTSSSRLMRVFNEMSQYQANHPDEDIWFILDYDDENRRWLVFPS